MSSPKPRVLTAPLLGAISSSVAASCFIVGFVVYVTLFAQNSYPNLTASTDEQVRFMIAHSDFLQFWYAIIYLLFGGCLVVLVPVLCSYVADAELLLATIASLFGLIWSALVIFSGLLINVGIGQVADLYLHNGVQATTLWLVLYAIVDGLGGGNELIGGLWILLISLAAYRCKRFPVWLSLVGALAGTAGVGTWGPGPELLELMFGLGSIVWFIGVSVSVLNSG